MEKYGRDDITPEVLRELLDYDPSTGVLTWKHRDRKWFGTDRSWRTWNTRFAGEQAFRTPKDVCIVRLTGDILGHRFYASRVAWAIYHGSWPVHAIDHVNGDEGDNRISNMRDVPQGDNCRNASRRKDNTSGVPGVSWNKDRGKWLVTISAEKGRRYVGIFDRKADAIVARKAAEREHGYHENHGRVCRGKLKRSC
jgi:hypothetical protein